MENVFMEIKRDVVTITINNPEKMNCLDTAMLWKFDLLPGTASFFT